MRIYEMTATFGKLEKQTLSLQPGLNIIQAPNEWGKSTWCAFLLAMLYGIDTRERSKQGALADKERYAPWSGAAMEGRIRLHWQGRDITIERSSTPRMPLGIFKAYDTHSGTEIEELNGANCGQMLLGVERSVFLRAGFLRLSDMPVTQDDALRRRLNDLVTTGDESDSADRLGKTLKDLRNRCRSNRSNGLLPEAEQQRQRLRDQLWEIEELQNRMTQAEAQIRQREAAQKALEIHLQTIAYNQAESNFRRLEEAEGKLALLAKEAAQLRQKLKMLPDLEEAHRGLPTAQKLAAEEDMLARRKEALPPQPAQWAGADPEEALEEARKDRTAWLDRERKLAKQKRIFGFLGFLAGVCAIGAVIAFILSRMIPGIGLGLGALILAAVAGIGRSLAGKQSRAFYDSLSAKHPGSSPDDWEANGQKQLQEYRKLAEEQARYQALMESWQQDQEAFREKAKAFGDPKQKEQAYSDALNAHRQLERVTEEQAHLTQLCEEIRALVANATKPTETDTLDYSLDTTLQYETQNKEALAALKEALSKDRGRLEAIGNASALREQLLRLDQRISALETYEAALQMAQDALHQASLSLQQKFAPRISKRAGQLFSALTDGRYDRITLDSDLSVQTAASDEVVLRQSLYRSEGTVDQLYLSLRLASAEALTPEAPLVLDDALARFDDTRTAAALEVLEQMAQSKQVILFTCRKRETNNVM